MEEVSLACIDGYKEELKALSEQIWKHPELCYEEHKAHALLTDYLESKGFEVTRQYCGIPTAFKATLSNATSNGTTTNVCVICEYDALPEIGHACGHNLIAEAGVAAGLGLKAAIEKGEVDGRVTIIGTPAEEGGGGKAQLIEKGGFEGISIALMVHPSPKTSIFNSFLAMSEIEVNYTGKASHAAAFPHEGINALDAAILAYNNVSALRQQLKTTWRVHGIISNGGVKPNIIPEKASLTYMFRSPTKTELKDFRAKLVKCFEGAATATNCTLDITEVGYAYDDLITNPILGNLYEKHLKSLGCTDIKQSNSNGSTDMGNVSQIVPSIHPKYGIGDGKAGNHTHEFTKVSNEADSHDKTLIAAKAMVLTGIEVLKSKTLLTEIQEAFRKEKNSQ